MLVYLGNERFKLWVVQHTIIVQVTKPECRHVH